MRDRSLFNFRKNTDEVIFLRGLRFAGLLVLSVAFSIFGTSFVARAISPLDDAYQTTSSLVVGDSAGVTGAVVPPTDITANWPSYITNPATPGYSASVATSLKAAFAHGRWGVSQQPPTSPGTLNTVLVFWTECTSLKLNWYDASPWYGIPNYHVVFAGTDSSCSLNYIVLGPNPVTGSPVYIGTYGGTYASCSSTYCLPIADNLGTNNYFTNSDHINYPTGTGYGGATVVDLSVDSDGDGLSAAQESAQGTSDSVYDMDGDGLSDKVESVWNTNRDNEFCDIATTPYTCAYPDPLKKDVYVEMDWMNDGTTSYKPNNTQIGLVSDAFAAKGIYFHADTGQYGGGNELPIYISALKFEPDTIDTDFFNLKNGDSTYSPNFAEERRGIWHYMIAGNQYDDGTTLIKSGVAYPGDDDALVALGQVASSHPSSVDTAVAGTIIHELGHNLCLSDTAYSGQNSSCLSSLVDSYAGSDYLSAMNYDKQFSLVDYSNGNNSNDHDDWSAIFVGMKDFVSYGEDPPEGLLRRGVVFDKQPQY